MHVKDNNFVNHTVRITVARTLAMIDLAEEVGAVRPGDAIEGTTLHACPFFKEGMVFEVFTDPLGNCKPEGFCDWAWADIWKDVLLVADRSGHAEDVREVKPHFCCCTDGLRPVIFKLEAVD